MAGRATTKLYRAGTWLTTIPKAWDGTAWARPEGDYTYQRRSIFYPRYYGAGTVWDRSVTNMPLATKSADYANWMATHINYGAGFGETGFNSSTQGTYPVQAHVVDSRLGGSQAHMTGTFPAGFGEAVLGGWVPWPEYPLKQQGGQDTGVVIWDVGTGIVREYYFVRGVEGSPDHFTATTGGYSIYEPGFENIAATDYFDNVGRQEKGSGYATRLAEGIQTVVAQHNHLGFIDVAGCLTNDDTTPGTLNHAVAFTCSNMNVSESTAEAIRQDGTRYQHTGASWPAKNGDGDTVDDNAPIHGQWARLPLVLDKPLEDYRPMTQTIIKAAQTYGIVATDSNNFVHAFNAEHADYWKQQLNLDVDPWNYGGIVRKKYELIAAIQGIDPDKCFDVGDFPWHLTEWAPRNWGKPD